MRNSKLVAVAVAVGVMSAWGANAHAELISYFSFNGITDLSSSASAAAQSVTADAGYQGTLTFSSGIKAADQTFNSTGTTLNAAPSVIAGEALKVQKGTNYNSPQDYIDLTFNALTYTNLTFSLAASSTGETATLQYAISSGGTFTNFGNVTPGASFSTVGPLNLSALDNQGTAIVRFFLGGDTGSNSKSLTIDNIRVDGTSAVPVPAAVWLLGSGIAGIGAMVRRRRAGVVKS